jgi:protease IV
MRIITKIFAFIGAMVVGSFTFGLLIGWLWTPSSPEVPARTVLMLDFSAPIVETHNPSLLDLATDDPAISLRALTAALDRARRDDRVKGLWADLSDVNLNAAQVEEVRAALQRFKASGKFAFAYADSFGELGPGNRAYWLASAFDKIWLQPLGNLGLTGAALEVPFVRGGLDKLGLRPDVRQRYEYKGAAESFTEKSMSTPMRENYTRLLSDMHSTLLSDIGSARKLERATLDRLVDSSPLLAKEALEAKLIDVLGYADEAKAAANAAARADDEKLKMEDVSELEATEYLAMAGSLPGETKADVALIYADGPIVSRSAGGGPMAQGGEAIAAELVPAIQDATKNKTIKAIVLRIDSPGGSVTASESIHRALLQAKAAGKFIVVSMGGTAASGGYWIATAADKIIAQPSTLTGSIGVVGGKLVIGSLSEKLGVKWDGIKTGANSDMFSPAAPFSPAASARIDASMDEIYAAFTQRVADSRKLDAGQIDKLARGRVWTGVSAKELGLVDELGGLREAFNAVRTHLGLSEDDLLMVYPLPAPESTTDVIWRIAQQLIALPTLAPLSLTSLKAELQAALGLPALSTTGSVVYMGPRVGE